MMRPLIEVRDLRFRYDDGTPALNGVNFRLEEGETVALLGPNGSGKTTFVLHLNGLLSGEGSVEVCGLPVNRANMPAIRRKIGMVFQDSESQLFMPTVLEDVAFGPLNRGLRPRGGHGARPGRARRRWAWQRPRPRAPYHLSAGEKKRVAIAGILAIDPEILVLDEPTTFLDPPGQRAGRAAGQLTAGQDPGDTRHSLRAGAVQPRGLLPERRRSRRKAPVEEMAQRYGWDFQAPRTT